jgi:hypothetical protein
MKRLITALLLLVASYGRAQNSLDSAKILYTRFLNIDEGDYAQNAARLEVCLTRWIQSVAAQTALPDSVIPFSLVKSADGDLLVLTWDYPVKKNQYVHAGLLFLFTAQKTVFLEDHSQEISSPEKSSLSANRWFGARYYRLIEFQQKRSTKYLLLGANFADPLMKKKIIESMEVDMSGKVTFGLPCFSDGKRRVLLRYNPSVGVSLKYDEAERRIIFDHLVPENTFQNNQFQFYAPDLSYDSYRLQKGKWVLKEAIDARNEK